MLIPHPREISPSRRICPSLEHPKKWKMGGMRSPGETGRRQLPAPGQVGARRQAAACPTMLPSAFVQELGMRKKLLLLFLPTSWKGCQSLAGASPQNPTLTPERPVPRCPHCRHPSWWGFLRKRCSKASAAGRPMDVLHLTDDDVLHPVDALHPTMSFTPWTMSFTPPYSSPHG